MYNNRSRASDRVLDRTYETVNDHTVVRVV